MILATMAKPRLEGHKLTNMGTVRATCECGTMFHIRGPEVAGRRIPSLQDELMDRHSRHIESVKLAKQERLRRKIKDDDE